MSFAEICDVAYLLQVQAIERETLAIQSQAPFVEEGVRLPTVAEAIAEFDAALAEELDDEPVLPEDAEMAELYGLLSVRGRG